VSGPALIPPLIAKLKARIRRLTDSLAGRLLVLTVAIVLIGEALLFAPALAEFHEGWLRDRINLAQTAALALEAAPEAEIAPALREELLQNAEVKRIALKRAEERVLLLEEPFDRPPTSIKVFDYTEAGIVQKFGWAFDTLFAADGRVLRVLAQPRFESGEAIEIVLNEAPLKRDLGRFASHFFFVSLLILIAAAGLIYAALVFAFVRPMRHLTRAIERFRDAPEDASTQFVRSSRADEIGRAERAAADMAGQIRSSLRQRGHLAALGAAVARIAHDLRNALATAQITTERLARSPDDDVRMLSQRLERAIDRASRLAENSLQFGRADEAAPAFESVNVETALREAMEDASSEFSATRMELGVEPDLCASADPDYLHRILVNLLRNAGRAMQRRAKENTEGKIHARAFVKGDRVIIEIADQGPGVPDKLRETLFAPFVSADRQGGTGLGLAIARELARAMGGDVMLVKTGVTGTVFGVELDIKGAF
jgi:signal transduction histidine kinase